MPTFRNGSDTITPSAFEIGESTLSLIQLRRQTINAGTNDLDHSANTSSAV